MKNYIFYIIEIFTISALVIPEGIYSGYSQSHAKADPDQLFLCEHSTTLLADNSINETEEQFVAFTVSTDKGCSPLEISFINNSTGVSNNLWNFGDGSTSTEENPSYIYNEPGLFVVILEATGFDGEIYKKSDTIVVYESPDAIFEINTDMNMFPESPVFFYN